MLVRGSSRIKIDQINRHPDFLNFTSTKNVYIYIILRLETLALALFDCLIMSRCLYVSLSKLLESMV